MAADPIVLIVEDDADIRDALTSVFEARGMPTWLASNGQEALDLVRHQGTRPAVILLDLLMPVMDGCQFLVSAEREPLLAGVPVVVVTAQPRRAAELPTPVHAVLEKPVAVPTLIQSVQEACKE